MINAFASNLLPIIVKALTLPPPIENKISSNRFVIFILPASHSHKFHLAVYLNAIRVVIYHPSGIWGFFYFPVFQKSFFFLLFFLLKNVFQTLRSRLHTGQFHSLLNSALKVTKINYLVALHSSSLFIASRKNWACTITKLKNIL